MKITKEEVKPYLSVLVAHSPDEDRTVKDFAERVKEMINTSIEVSSCTEIEVEQIDQDSEVASFFFKEACAPSWAPESDLRDLLHHFSAVIRYKSTYSFYFSDPDLKNKFLDNMDEDSELGLKRIKQGILNYAFLTGDGIKTLWLYGIHRRTEVKPDSKILAGLDLINAIDHIGDQTYAYSAVRTQVKLEEKKRTVGINPSKSSIWLGPTGGWDNFIRLVIGLSKLVSSTTKEELAPIHTLSYSTTDINDLQGAYDFSFVDIDTIPSESRTTRTFDFFEEIIDDYDFELIESPEDKKESFILSVSLKDDAGNIECGTVIAKPVLSKTGVSFDVSLNEVKGKKGKLKKFSRIFNSPRLLRGWYKSGHVLSDGQIHLITYRDAKFEDFTWVDFSGFDVTKEKPLDVDDKLDLDKIGKTNSLFCWTKQNWPHNVDLPYLKGTEKHKGWLVCDDGSGEKADFIHAVNINGEYHFSLIHIKASGSSKDTRQISVGAHDIVLNQAIKNIRNLDRTLFLEAVKSKVSATTQNLVWEDGTQKHISDFTNFLDGINARISPHVVVVQPHTREKYHANSDHLLVRKQLDTLLHNAKYVVASVGASFDIIGSKK
ncbi:MULTISPECIES: hypothetical protein [Vibrio]|nr:MULTISPECIES: hypothetical protein [Vibrio]HCE1840192.1 hypothetical protein [Vibrio parahaemolyticus]MCA2422755.1 hypothetical protein [Vibrio alginolyticus]MCA2447400.1 hypothetical protein [Vibrio alginolyticus]MDW2067535.1 hypothetical protein [Vibrio sp. 1579]MDW2161500.1 hypothetical protein [Vibrio sp. 1942]